MTFASAGRDDGFRAVFREDDVVLTDFQAEGTGRGAHRSAAVLLWALVWLLEVYGLLVTG